MKYLLLIFFLIGQFVNAQETKLDTTFYFNTMYNPYIETSELVSMAVEKITDGYLVFGGYAPSFYDHRNYVRKLNKNGEEVWFKDYDFGTSEERGVIERGEQIIQNTTGNIILAYSYDTTGTGIRSLQKLVEMDVEGNILKSALIGDTSKHQISRSIIEVEDGYILLGSETTIGVQLEVTLKKLSYDFEVVWTEYFNMDSAFFVRETFWDNGFLITGYSYTNTETEYDAHIIKLNNFGEIEWENKPLAKGNSTATFPIILPIDNNLQEYILFSAIDPPDSIDFLYNSNLISFEKYNYNGELIFNKTYTQQDKTILIHSAKIINDSTIIALAHHNFDYADIDGLLLNISSEDGEIRWTKQIQTNDEIDRQDYLRDLQITEDGGYIMAGYRSSPGVRQSWVVKTDSLGNTCGFVNCDSISVVEIPIISSNNYLDIESNGFRVYPNPASDYLMLTERNQSNYLLQNQRYSIVNALGQTLAQGKLAFGNSINIQYLPKGLYILQVDNRFSLKFIKQ